MFAYIIIDFWRWCDTEDWSNDAENTALITEINYSLTHIHMLFYIIIIFQIIAESFRRVWRVVICIMWINACSDMFMFCIMWINACCDMFIWIWSAGYTVISICQVWHIYIWHTAAHFMRSSSLKWCFSACNFPPCLIILFSDVLKSDSDWKPSCFRPLNEDFPQHHQNSLQHKHTRLWRHQIQCNKAEIKILRDARETKHMSRHFHLRDLMICNI